MPIHWVLGFLAGKRVASIASIVSHHRGTSRPTRRLNGLKEPPLSLLGNGVAETGSLPPYAFANTSQNYYGVSERARGACLRRLVFPLWLKEPTTSGTVVHDANAESSALCDGSGGDLPPPTKRAALVIRGRGPVSGSKTEEDELLVATNYLSTVVCPLRRSGHRVQSFVATYGLSEATRSALRPTTLALLRTKGSSQVGTVTAAFLRFYDYARAEAARGARPFEVVVLLRADLLLKQSLLALPGVLPFTQRVTFAFKEVAAVWRQLNWSSVHHKWLRERRTSDMLHAIDGALLPCFAHALANYLFRPKESLHYLLTSLLHFVGSTRVGFMVDSSFDSDPLKGMRNPIYDIVPRLRKYDTSVCSTLADFAWDEASASYCCEDAASHYCCPNSRVTPCDGARAYGMALVRDRPGARKKPG